MQHDIEKTKAIIVESYKLAIEKAKRYNTPLVTWDRKAGKIIEYDPHTLKPLTACE